MYEQVVQKRGQPLREGFTIVKVRAARLACMCSLFPMAGRWSGRSEIARDAHACARFSQWPDGGPAVRRSREMRMHVLSFPMAGRWSGRSEIARDVHACARFPNGRTVVRPFGDRARCACMCSLSQWPDLFVTEPFLGMGPRVL